MKNGAVQDIERIRAQAMQSIEDGPVTSANKMDRKALLTLLDAALVTEWICVLRYSQHAVTASGIQALPVAQHFEEHAKEELDHAHRIAERIHQVGGTPNLDPAGFPLRAHTRYKECDSLVEMIEENLIAERIAITSYTDMVRTIGDADPTTRRLFEKILAEEEEHATDMASLLEAFDPREHVTHKPVPVFRTIDGKKTDRVDEASRESFPASDPPAY